MYKETEQGLRKVLLFLSQDVIVKSGQIIGNLIIYTAMHRLQIIKSKLYCKQSKTAKLPWNSVIIY